MAVPTQLLKTDVATARAVFDRRRIFVPLDKNVWVAKDKTLQIEVQDQFIRVTTPQKPHN